MLYTFESVRVQEKRTTISHKTRIWEYVKLVSPPYQSWGFIQYHISKYKFQRQKLCEETASRILKGRFTVWALSQEVAYSQPWTAGRAEPPFQSNRITAQR